MTAQFMARSVYTNADFALRTPRRIEFDAFARVTRALRLATNGTDQPFANLAQALDDNRHLWMVLACDVAKPANQLDSQLKARIFYLAEFTFHHTQRVLAREGDVAVLIDINTAMMRGLSGTEELP